MEFTHCCVLVAVLLFFKVSNAVSTAIKHNGCGKLRYFQRLCHEKLPFIFFLFLGQAKKKFKIIVNIYYKLLRIS